MKRTPLRRRTPLTSTPYPLARARLAPRSQRSIETAPDRAVVRERVLARDRCCQVHTLGHGAYAVGRCHGPLTPHHRRKASQGGGYTFDNLVAVCAHHNDEMEANAALSRWARTVGLVVRRGDEGWAELGRGR